MKDLILETINSSINTKDSLLSQSEIIESMASEIINAYKKNKKVLICGNGGSAADSQHFSAELVGRFKKERRALNAIALTVDTSILTAVGNDYGFEKIFSRQVDGLGGEGDVLVAISTSGNSKNVIDAVKSAKHKGMKVLCLLGNDGGLLKNMCDKNNEYLCLVVNSKDTARIQECHILVIHILCDLVDKELFK